jgi:ATP-binding cassette, subfamily B, bacterial MsbA
MGMFRRRKKSPEQDAPEVPNTPMQWRRMIGYLSPYKPRLAVALFALLITSATSLVFPAVIQNVVDSVLQQENYELLNTITLGLLAVFLVRVVSEFIENYN